MIELYKKGFIQGKTKSKIMKNYFLKIGVCVVAAIFMAVSVRAAQTGDVTATVTAQSISVAVTDGAVSYGTIATSTTEDTTSSGVNDSQTADNDGNVTEDFNVRGFNTAAWTLAGTAGAENYTHKFCTTTCDTTPSWTALTTNYQQLSNDVADTGNQVFDLEIGTPTTTATYTQQTATVTVQAVYYQ